mmetsp:Transcript_23969/g.40024  ORF Transcript_23969/g.40024 Transcript_23969/m.40024 type:complete len:590 (-) Transcript_23969:403-2172(-)
MDVVTKKLEDLNLQKYQEYLTLKHVGILGAVYVTYSTAFFLSYYFFPREDAFPENYPFEGTWLLVKNNHRLLDFCHEYFVQTYQRKGKKTYVVKSLGLDPLVMTTDVANVTHVLKTNFENYGKSAPQIKNKFQGLLGDGIFNADGQQWFSHRKTSANLFKLNEFKTTVLNIFNHDLDTCISVMKPLAASNQSFDIQALMHKFTLESISQIAFGLELGCITSERVQFADDFDYVTACVNDSFTNPFWLLQRLFTPYGWHYFLALYRLNKFAYGVIRDRRKLVQESSFNEASTTASAKSEARVGRNDLLTLYLKYDDATGGGGGGGRSSGGKSGAAWSGKSGGTTSTKSNASTSSTGSTGSGSLGSKYGNAYMEPNDSNLRDVILNMIIAGRDTTAQALSWTFYELCLHPEVQQNIRDEVFCNVGVGESHKAHIAEEGDQFTYDSLQRCKYTEAVCMEALRLHPSVPKEAKVVMQDEVLPDGTACKRGDILSFQPWSMGRDPDLWGEDCLEFKPERFVDKPKPSPFVFTAFQAGPRTCLGQNFAMLEMKVTLARLCSAFEFKLMQPADSVTYAMSLTLPIKGGLKVAVKAL